MATGSGIGPCLPHLLAAEVPSRLVWATRDPRTTYGDALVDEILAVQPDALIWDTSRHGKPDMVRLAYAAYRGLRRRGRHLHLQQEAHLAGGARPGAAGHPGVRRDLGLVDRQEEGDDR